MKRGITIFIVEENEREGISTVSATVAADIPEKFILVEGGAFLMGSPEDEAWRSDDETQPALISFSVSKRRLNL